MSDERENFLQSVSLFLSIERVLELTDKFSYTDCDYDFYSYFLDGVLALNNSKLKELFTSNFYNGFFNSIISNLLHKRGLVLDDRFWAEEKISGLLIEVIGKDAVMRQVFEDPNKIGCLLENINYQNESLLGFINRRISKLRYNNIKNMDVLVKNKVAMDIVEAISDCNGELNFDNKKLIR